MLRVPIRVPGALDFDQPEKHPRAIHGSGEPLWPDHRTAGTGKLQPTFNRDIKEAGSAVQVRSFGSLLFDFEHR
jgi:hypothetical protein